MAVTIRYIGKSADELRFFISFHDQHAGGITVHSVKGNCFSYGIAVAPSLRRKGIAKAALSLLFEDMHKRGYARAVAKIAPDNAASLALHASLGFKENARNTQAVTMEKEIGSPYPSPASTSPSFS